MMQQVSRLSLGYLLAGECVGLQHLDILRHRRTARQSDGRPDRQSCDVQHGLRSFAVACGARVKGFRERKRLELELGLESRLEVAVGVGPIIYNTDSSSVPLSDRILAFIMWRSCLHTAIQKLAQIPAPSELALLGDKTSCTMMDATSPAHKLGLFRCPEDGQPYGGVGGLDSLVNTPIPNGYWETLLWSGLEGTACESVLNEWKIEETIENDCEFDSK